jgi:hypothetical protein
MGGSLREVKRVKQIPGPKTVFGPNRPWQGTQRAQARAGQSGAQRCGRLVRSWSEAGPRGSEAGQRLTLPYQEGITYTSGRLSEHRARQGGWVYGWMELKEWRLRTVIRVEVAREAHANQIGLRAGTSTWRAARSSSRAAVRWEYMDAAEAGRGNQKQEKMSWDPQLGITDGTDKCQAQTGLSVEPLAAL